MPQRLRSLQWLVPCLLASCGRIGFDHRADAFEVTSPPVLHFAFDSDGILVDRGPYHRIATCTACPVAGGGRVGDGAAAFDGTSCLAIAAGPELALERFTFAAWYNASAPQHGNLFGRPYQGTTGFQNSFETYVLMDSNVNVSVMQSTVATPSALAEWQHVAGVFDGSQLTAYVNGELRVEMSVSAPTYADDAFRIGCDVNFGSEGFHFDGSIDDVRLYDRPLTSDEVAALAAM